MALLTRKISCNGDSYTLFAPRDKPLYGIPYLDRSRSSIPSCSDGSSLQDKILRESSHDLSLAPTRNTMGSTGMDTRHSLQTRLVETLPSDDIAPPSPQSDDSDPPQESNDGCTSQAESFVTADSNVANTCTTTIGYDQEGSRPAFQKWMRSWRRKPLARKERPTIYLAEDILQLERTISGVSGVDARTTASSNMLVNTVRTASIDYSSLHSVVEPIDEPSESMLDSSTLKRMQDRKHAVEELISTEEYYVRDLKSILERYIPMLKDCVWISMEMIEDIERNLTDILELHSRLLRDIYSALPCTSQIVQGQRLDVSPKIGEMERGPILADPSAAAELARVYDTMMRGFFVYEEYAAKYEMVSKHVRRFWKSNELSHGKGSETLTGTANSWDNRCDYGKRAMELDDMLVKPIQRVCKYSLLFREINQYTPAIDCPESNRLLEKVRQRFDDTARQVNRANRDASRIRERIEKTWVLQDRLAFPGKRDFPVRLLGHVLLCGALHITRQCVDSVEGSYMACFLFESSLLIATTSKADVAYRVRMAIPLAMCRIEQPNQGKGLHCPSTPHSWKLVFEIDHRIYEILATACSAEEERAWKSQLLERIHVEGRDYQDYTSSNVGLYALVEPGMKPIGDAVGRPGTLHRRQSLHFSGLVSLLDSDVTYIVINNTLGISDVHSSAGGSSMLKRSQSAVNVTRSSVPTFNLRRTERNRVESKLVDLWSRDLLPYMATNPEGQKRPSAAKMIRRLSVVSIVSSVARKSVQSLHSSASSGDIPSQAVGLDDDTQDTSVVRRSSTVPFITSKSSGKSEPSSQAKRSSSLNSRFSFTGSTRKESSLSRSNTRCRKALNDGKRRLSLLSADGKSPTAERQPSEDMLDDYFPTMPLSTPTDSILDEPLGGVFMEDYKATKAEASSSRRTGWEGAEEDRATWRRNTLFVPSRRSPATEEANAIYRKRRTWEDGAPMMDDLNEMVPWCSNPDAAQQIPGLTIATM